MWRERGRGRGEGNGEKGDKRTQGEQEGTRVLERGGGKHPLL
jgi:hypothetical protein